jgi:hypothetical protein
MKKYLIALIACINSINCHAQPANSSNVKNDSLAFIQPDSLFKIAPPGNRSTLKPSSFVVPVALISYGFVALRTNAMKNFDKEIQEEIWQDHPHKPFAIDNYLQYAPAFFVYALNAAGIKGQNKFGDRTMIYLMANAMMGATVQSLKSITKIQRPDGGGTNAFPSGHTATAFVAAEFLRREYKDVSPWYGIAGYTMATATAYLRMYNNKHWFRDLLPGAGIGMLSTDLAYCIYPSIKRVFFKNKPMNTMIMPYYEQSAGGLTLVHDFH